MEPKPKFWPTNHQRKNKIKNERGLQIAPKCGISIPINWSANPGMPHKNCILYWIISSTNTKDNFISSWSRFFKTTQLVKFQYWRYRNTLLCIPNGTFNLQSFCLRLKGLPLLSGSLFSFTFANFHTQLSDSVSMESSIKTPSFSWHLDATST